MYDFEIKYYKQKIMEETDKLNTKQKEAFDYMVKGHNLFITGQGGVGKTSVIKIFCKLYTHLKKIAITSTTGVSAILLGGTTLHSYLGIGLGDFTVKTYVDIINNNSWFKKKWVDLDILVIDEISMLNPELFDKIEEIARIIRKNDKVFGGIQLILSGDMCQLGCVNSNKFVFESNCWNKSIDKIVYLTDIIRQSEIEFQTCLSEIRLGYVSDTSLKLLESRVGIELKNNVGIKPTKIFPRNYSVDEINNKELSILKNKDVTIYEYDMEYEFYSKIKNKDMLIEKYTKHCIAPVKLQICVNAQVMLLCNLDLDSELVNGSRGIITDFIEDRPLVKFLNGEERLIDYNFWACNENQTKVMDIIQIPLKLAYATSAHKIQGVSLDYAEIDLSDVFCYGQAYIMLSRVKKIHGLSIKKLDINKITAHPKAIEFYKNLEKI